jgi:hypothetical protein
MLACLALGLILMMRFWPGAALSRVLHLYLVERPVRWCATVERHKVIQIVIIAALLLSTEQMVAMFGPEFLFTYSLDLSLYLDAVVVTAALAAASQLTAIARHLRARLSFRRAPAARPVRGAVRERRSRKRRVDKPADNDDRPAVAFMLAA